MATRHTKALARKFINLIEQTEREGKDMSIAWGRFSKDDLPVFAVGRQKPSSVERQLKQMKHYDGLNKPKDFDKRRIKVLGSGVAVLSANSLRIMTKKRSVNQTKLNTLSKVYFRDGFGESRGWTSIHYGPLTANDLVAFTEEPVEGQAAEVPIEDDATYLASEGEPDEEADREAVSPEPIGGPEHGTDDPTLVAPPPPVAVPAIPESLGLDISRQAGKLADLILNIAIEQHITATRTRDNLKETIILAFESVLSVMPPARQPAGLYGLSNRLLVTLADRYSLRAFVAGEFDLTDSLATPFDEGANGRGRFVETMFAVGKQASRQLKAGTQESLLLRYDLDRPSPKKISDLVEAKWRVDLAGKDLASIVAQLTGTMMKAFGNEAGLVNLLSLQQLTAEQLAAILAAELASQTDIKADMAAAIAEGGADDGVVSDVLRNLDKVAERLTAAYVAAAEEKDRLKATVERTLAEEGHVSFAHLGYSWNRLEASFSALEIGGITARLRALAHLAGEPARQGIAEATVAVNNLLASLSNEMWGALDHAPFPTDAKPTSTLRSGLHDVRSALGVAQTPLVAAK